MTPGASGLHSPADPAEGGEFQLLLSRLRSWWTEAQELQLWQQSRRPLALLLGLVGLLMGLHVASGLVQALRTVPLLPGLLELVSLAWLVRAGLPRLLGNRPG